MTRWERFANWLIAVSNFLDQIFVLVLAIVLIIPAAIGFLIGLIGGLSAAGCGK